MYSRGVKEEHSAEEAIAAVHPDRPTDPRMTVRELLSLGLSQPSVVDAERASSIMEMGLCRFLVEKMRGAVRLRRRVPEDLLSMAREAGTRQGWNLPGAWGDQVRESIHESDESMLSRALSVERMNLAAEGVSRGAAVPEVTMLFDTRAGGADAAGVAFTSNGKSGNDELPAERRHSELEGGTDETMVAVGAPPRNRGENRVLEDERSADTTRTRGRKQQRASPPATQEDG